MTNIDPAIVEALTDVRMREHFGKCWDDISTDPAYDEALKSYRNFYRQHADDALAALAPLIAAAVDAARAEGYEQGKAAVREAVEAVHRPQPERVAGYQHLYCMGCWSTWPCRTARALTEAATP